MKNIYIDSKKRTVNDTGKYALQINYVFGLFDLKPDFRFQTAFANKIGEKAFIA